MKIRLSNPLQSDSIVDGEGIRTVIWTQGCPHHCKGCHNPETHSFNKGFLKETSEIIEEIKSLELQDGITFSGGDPMVQPEACLEIAKACKEMNLNIWCYTGFMFEELLEDPIKVEFLKYIDLSLNIELSTLYPKLIKYISINTAVVLVLPSLKGCICQIEEVNIEILLIKSTIFISL